MRKYITAVFLFAVQVMLADVTVSISDGIDNEDLKRKMELRMSALLTEVNNAQAENRMLRFHGMGLSTDVQSSMSMLWENSPFTCADEYITESCITTGQVTRSGTSHCLCVRRTRISQRENTRRLSSVSTGVVRLKVST